MLLSSLRQLSRASVPGAKTTVISNTVLDIILKNGAKDVALRAKCLPTSTKFGVTAEEANYVISDELTRYLCPEKTGLWWNAGSASSPDWQRLKPRTKKYLDNHRNDWRNGDSDDPQEYVIHGNTITINPKPDTTLSEGFWMYYFQAPTPMSGASNSYAFDGTTEITHLSACFDEAIILYARMKMLPMISKKKTEGVGVPRKEYLQALADGIYLFNRRPDIANDSKTRMRGRTYGRSR